MKRRKLLQSILAAPAALFGVSQVHEDWDIKLNQGNVPSMIESGLVVSKTRINRPLRVYVNDKPIGYATNCFLDVDSTTKDISSELTIEGFYDM